MPLQIHEVTCIHPDQGFPAAIIILWTNGCRTCHGWESYPQQPNLEKLSLPNAYYMYGFWKPFLLPIKELEHKDVKNKRRKIACADTTMTRSTKENSSGSAVRSEFDEVVRFCADLRFTQANQTNPQQLSRLPTKAPEDMPWKEILSHNIKHYQPDSDLKSFLSSLGVVAQLEYAARTITYTSGARFLYFNKQNVNNLNTEKNENQTNENHTVVATANSSSTPL